MARFRRVASVNDVPEGQGIAVEVEGKRIALFNIDGEFFAIEATCAQHHAPLEKGVIQAQSLHCPWHGVAFDVAKGICSARTEGSRCSAQPLSAGVSAYRLRCSVRQNQLVGFITRTAATSPPACCGLRASRSIRRFTATERWSCT
jgi:nitrite reductase/ring-hydroxylating ferredoxin subunit